MLDFKDRHNLLWKYNLILRWRHGEILSVNFEPGTREFVFKEVHV